MQGLKLANTLRSRSLWLIAAALATSGLFKIAAFGREAFIAARFGLSSVTDAYFALQQLPMTVASYMFGAFTLAFAPAFAAARREQDSVDWLPGLTLFGVLAGVSLTGLMLSAAPVLLRMVHSDGSASAWSTLRILSLCFVPVVLIGLWAGVCNARGHNLASMTTTGLPFLVMTAWLVGLYAAAALNDLSLPLSMTAGFGIVGLYSLIRLVALQPASFCSVDGLSIWRIAAFRSFLRQLGVSSLENAGFAANQLLIVYALSRSGVGVISGNNCAMRIGMLGYTLMGMPLAQLVQARLCATTDSERPARFRRWLGMTAGLIALVTVSLFTFSNPIIRIVYMHGRFQGAELQVVAGLLPAWIVYIAVMSMNGILSRYLFIQSRGATYVRRQLAAYAAAGILRFAITGRFDPAFAIWSSAATEGCAMLLNLRGCLAMRAPELATPEAAAPVVPASVEVAG